MAENAMRRYRKGWVDGENFRGILKEFGKFWTNQGDQKINGSLEESGWIKSKNRGKLREIRGKESQKQWKSINSKFKRNWWNAWVSKQEKKIKISENQANRENWMNQKDERKKIW